MHNLVRSTMQKVQIHPHPGSISVQLPSRFLQHLAGDDAGERSPVPICSPVVAALAAAAATAVHPPWRTVSDLAVCHHLKDQGAGFLIPMRCRTRLPAVAAAAPAVAAVVPWAAGAAGAAGAAATVTSGSAVASAAALVAAAHHPPCRTPLSSPQAPPVLSTTFVSPQPLPARSNPFLLRGAVMAAAVAAALLLAPVPRIPLLPSPPPFLQQHQLPIIIFLLIHYHLVSLHLQ